MGTWQARWRMVAPALAIVITLAIVAGLVAVVSGLVAARHAATGSTTPSIWQTLADKPLHLSRLAAGQSCVATPTRHNISPDYSSTVGNGPAYVVATTADGVFTYIPPDLFNTGQATGQSASQGTSSAPALGGTKVRWQIAPTYTGAILIRGRQLDGPNQLYFNGGLDQPNGNALGTEPTLSQLRLMGGGATAPTWPTWVTLTRLAHPGCYAYQVDGVSFSYTITFQAVSEVG